MNASRSSGRTPRPVIIVALASILALMLAVGLAVSIVQSRSVTKKVNLSTLRWAFYAEDLNRLNAANPNLMKQVLGSPATYALVSAGSGAVPRQAIPAQDFSAYADLQSALQSGGMVPGVKAALYDPENWAATPSAEQQNPVHYMQLFGQAARSHGYTGILAPARDLAQVSGAACSQATGETLTQAYLRCSIASAAAYAPVFVIQAAPVETDLPQFTQLVQQASAQARAANRTVVVLVTLSTEPNGVPVSATVLTQAARAALPYVQGFLPNSTAATDGTMLTCLNNLANGS